MEKTLTSKMQQKTARIAGIFYTLMIPLGAFGIMYVPTSIIVAGNIEATIINILANIDIFRVSIVSAIIVQISHLFIVLLLYKLLKIVNKNIALLMVLFMLISIPIAIINELNHFAIIHIVTNSNTITEQTSSLLNVFIKLHADGILMAGIFWGLWLFPMGYLVFKSSFLPKLIGIFLMIACCGYVIDSLMKLLFPDYSLTLISSILECTMYGEILFPLWLLFRGININQYEVMIKNL